MRLIILVCCLLPGILMAEPSGWTLKVEGLKPSDKTALFENLDFELKYADEALKQRISRDIRNYLALVGYYDPQIDCHLEKPCFLCAFRTPTQHLQCKVSYGPPLLIHTISVQLEGRGQKDPTLEERLQNCPLKQGMRFEHAAYEAYKAQLLNKALEQGYLEAAFRENQVYVDPLQHQAHIKLSLATGEPFSFGAISFPQAPYPTAYLGQYLRFKPGDLYRTERLFELQKDLLDSELFKRARVEPEPAIDGSRRVPLKVYLDPKAGNHYTIGLGYGTDTGPRARLQWDHRREAYPGHRVTLSTKASQIANQARILYSMPLHNPRTTRLNVETQIVEEKPIDKKYSLRHETSLSAIKKEDHLERIGSIHYLSESFRDLPQTPKEHAHFLLPQWAYTWTWKASAFSHESHQGLRLGLKIQGGVAGLGSSTNIVRMDARFKGIKQLDEKTRLIIRGNGGAMDAKDKQKIPLSLRFFTGGDQTVRGFSYQSLGPMEKDPAGNWITVGGRYLVVGSIELERTLYKKMGIALFSDAGNAMNHLDQRLFYSVGTGLRFATALGSVRVDLAQAIPRNHRKPRLHLNFGVDF